MPDPRLWDMELIFYFGVVSLPVSDALIAGNDTYMNMGKGESMNMRKGERMNMGKGERKIMRKEKNLLYREKRML